MPLSKLTPVPSSVQAGDRVDFHMHTRASDGGWRPDQLVDYLAEHDFRVVAVCDHDTMASVDEAAGHAAARGIRLIPGVEFTTAWDGRQWHLLIYGIDRESEQGAGFAALLAQQQANLAAAAERGITVLEMHGHALPSLKEVVDGRALLPTYVLLTAIKDKHATNLQTAHELTKKYGEAMRVDMPLESVVKVAHEAGGICILAHPGRDDGEGILDAKRLDKMLAEIPIDGLEGHYRSYKDDDTEKYRNMALSRGLLVSCGSDSHAPKHPVNPRPYHAGWVVPFLDRLGIEVEDFNGVSWQRGDDVVLAEPVETKEPSKASESENEPGKVETAAAVVSRQRE